MREHHGNLLPCSTSSSVGIYYILKILVLIPLWQMIFSQHIFFWTWGNTTKIASHTRKHEGNTREHQGWTPRNTRGLWFCSDVLIACVISSRYRDAPLKIREIIPLFSTRFENFGHWDSAAKCLVERSECFTDSRVEIQFWHIVLCSGKWIDVWWAWW